jgi:hypothetical protein
MGYNADYERDTVTLEPGDRWRIAMLYYSGFPDHAVPIAQRYIPGRLAAAAGNGTWAALKIPALLGELQELTSGVQLQNWTNQALSREQYARLTDAIRQARRRQRQKAKGKPATPDRVKLSLTLAAAAALDKRARQLGVSPSEAILDALARPELPPPADSDELRLETLAATARSLMMGGKSYRQIATLWNLQGVQTKTGTGAWHHAGVKRLVDQCSAG